MTLSRDWRGGLRLAVLCWNVCGTTLVWGQAAAPSDVPLSDGGVLKTIDYSGEGSLTAAYGPLRFVVDTIGPTSDERAPRLRGFIAGQPIFVIRLDQTMVATATATVRVVQLEGTTPQVVFQHFTYGAHCCTETKIATRTETGWAIVDAPTIDGDGGYAFEDIAGDSANELVGADNSFLYAFSSYAGSVAPVKIQKLEGTRLVDVTRDSRFKRAVAASLADLEHDATENDRWHDNGFLAGWVATKILLGEGRAGWTKMLANYDKDPDWALHVCAEPLPLDKCPEKSQRDADLPEALRAHLLATGYITDIAAYPLPPGRTPDAGR